LYQVMPADSRSVPEIGEEEMPVSEHRKPDTRGGSHPAAVPEDRRVELVRLQPIEAEIVAARLRAAGFDVALGPIPVYESVGFTEGVPVLVFESEAEAASALLNADDGPQEQGA
ncbi:MAG TPA: hypothetical protein VNU75_01770, partial [Acidimicrobiales bacterium]|nr:hypothetical protein [Acidimicrobiales bacterium]